MWHLLGYEINVSPGPSHQVGPKVPPGDPCVGVVAAVDPVAREHARATDGWLDRAVDR
jgi:hypothetical protein